MKTIMGAAALLALALPLSAQNPPTKSAPLPRVLARAQNPLALDRPDEVVAVPWATLRQRLPGLDAARVRVVDPGSGAEVPSQPIDNDGDGTTDELLVLAGFEPGQTRAFAVEAAAATSPAKARAYARHIDDRDDIAWESDRIAYRIYGQGLWKIEPLKSSGIDVWPKRTRDLIVDRWYAKGHDAYHKDVGEGADFYTVGESLGAGGDGIWQGGKLYWPVNFKSWKVLAAGPVRAVFELTYDPFDAGGIKVSETRRFVMDAGQNLFREESTFRTDGANGTAPLTYAIGFVKHKEGQVGSVGRPDGSWSWISTWQPVEKKDGGHGELGLGVLLQRSSLADVKDADDHFFALATARPGTPVVHYIGAGWTASGDFRTPQDWWRVLDTLARRLDAPIRVTVEGTPAVSVR